MSSRQERCISDSPCRLSLPGASLPGTFHLYSLTDAEATRASAHKVQHAVVIGGSFIGLEVAASLRQRGLAVTLIERGVLLNTLHNQARSSFFKRAFEAQGVEDVSYPPLDVYNRQHPRLRGT